MCSAFTPHCRYDKSTIKFIGNVYCPTIMCSSILCVLKKSFQSGGTSYYQCRRCMCQVRNVPSREQTFRFSWTVTSGFVFLRARKNQSKIILEMPIVLESIVQHKSGSISIHGKIMMKTVTNVCNAKRDSTVWTFLLKAKTWDICCLAVMAIFVLSKRRLVTTKTKAIPFFGEMSPAITIKHTRTWAKKAKIIPFMAFSFRIPFGNYSNSKNCFHSNFIYFPSTLKQHDLLSLQRRSCLVSRLWTRCSYLDCKRSPSRKYKGNQEIAQAN